MLSRCKKKKTQKRIWFVSELHEIKYFVPPGSCAWLLWPSPVLALALPPPSSSEKLSSVKLQKANASCIVINVPRWMNQGLQKKNSVPFPTLMVKMAGGLINGNPSCFSKVHKHWGRLSPSLVRAHPALISNNKSIYVTPSRRTQLLSTRINQFMVQTYYFKITFPLGRCMLVRAKGTPIFPV